MSKSSKARKRIVKMIRAEVHILGEENLLYDECKKDFKQYCDDRIAYYDGIMGNVQILKHYKEYIIPQLRLEYMYSGKNYG